MLKWLESINQFQNQIQLDQDYLAEVADIKEQAVSDFLQKLCNESNSQELYDIAFQNKYSQISVRSELDMDEKRVFIIKGKYQIRDMTLERCFNFI